MLFLRNDLLFIREGCGVKDDVVTKKNCLNQDKRCDNR